MNAVEKDGASRWSWPVFLVVAVCVVLQNLSFGFFQQLEERLLISREKLEQSSALNEAAFGWPFVAAYCEAHKFNLIFYDLLWPWVTLRATADLVIGVFLLYAGTRYLTNIIDRCRWKLDIASLLAFTAFLAWKFEEGREIHTYHEVPAGAASWAIFGLVFPMMNLLVLFTWHWIIMVVSGRVYRFFHR